MPTRNNVNPLMNSSSTPSRRRFLQGSASAAALLGSPVFLLGADAPAKPATSAKEGASPAPAANPAAASTTQNSKLNVALCGSGGQGRSDMMGLLKGCGQNIVAVCDVDERQVAEALKAGGKEMAGAKTYTDYRRLLEHAKDYDAVIVGTPDHWHATLCTAFVKAGKHVYCEKPLTHSIAEARGMRELARANPKVVTQMGNQGSAEPSMRRSVELIRAGVLGQVRDVYAWMDGGGFQHAVKRPEDSEPIPPGFNWDMWCGPSPYRPFKNGFYHTFKWRGWYDFGNAQLADFGCHIFNTIERSLDLGYATKFEAKTSNPGMETSGNTNELKMHFPARQGSDPVRSLDPLTIHWYDGGPRPSDEILKDVIAAFGKVPGGGTLIVGEKGSIYAGPWNSDARIKLNDDAKFRGINDHEPTKAIPTVYPRKVSHMQEWVNAAKGTGKTWSGFDRGGHLTELVLAGVMALRMNRDIEWDGEAMKATNAPEADRIIHTAVRRAWMM